MAENFVRLWMREGDEQQLANIEEGDYVELSGSINGAPVAVRVYRSEDSGE